MSYSRSNGQSVLDYVPPHLKSFFRDKRDRHNGLDPYGFMTRGLVLYFPLWALNNGGTNSIQSIDAYRRTGTITGALWRPTHRLFDASDDKIVIPDHASLDITQELTLEGWVKLLNTGGNNSIMGKAATIWTQVSYILEIQNNEHPVFATSTDGSTPSNLDASVTLSANTWYHLCATFSKPARVIYIDGVAKANDSWNFDIHIGTSDLYIGKYAGDSATLDGHIGEVRVYSHALSAAEVLHNYNATSWRYQ